MSATNKAKLRTAALETRKNVRERPAKSRAIWGQFLDAFPLRSGQWLCSYIGVEPEVLTADWLQAWLAPASAARSPACPGLTGSQVRVAVPYCRPQHLELFHLQDWAELQPSRLGLWEPAAELRTADRRVSPWEIELFLVPGLAFDRRGNRLGFGKGYYDRLLQQKSPRAVAVALAFSDQLVPTVPSEPSWDVPVDMIITEREIVDCRSQQADGAP